ncbi:DUF4862 family protein [Jonesiaceae bacterium BS-20]|uniref:DUF4862 family protein n=1 Tax=Jonesiaceae bacterium BS-20 TaxID=3120821 RepID=A0AAU7DWC4_9MICO
MHKRVLGAYALFAGMPLEESLAAHELIAERISVDALEIPLHELPGRPERTWGRYDKDGLPKFIAKDLDVVITCIPTVMGRLSHNPAYGLASNDNEGRELALSDACSALAIADNAAQVTGRPRVFAVQVHSAPRPDFHSADAFSRSLETLLEKADPSVLLTVEHCDATRPDQHVAKGFLELSQEIEAVRAFGTDQLGITINWGRSMIEGHSGGYVNDHIAQAREAGVLKGLMFSGATHRSGPWGPAWQDGHMAPRGEHPLLVFSHMSLLGQEEIDAALAAAGSIAERAYTGVKITVQEGQDEFDRRFHVAQAAWDMIDKTLN